MKALISSFILLVPFSAGLALVVAGLVHGEWSKFSCGAFLALWSGFLIVSILEREEHEGGEQ